MPVREVVRPHAESPFHAFLEIDGRIVAGLWRIEYNGKWRIAKPSIYIGDPTTDPTAAELCEMHRLAKEKDEKSKEK